MSTATALAVLLSPFSDPASDRHCSCSDILSIWTNLVNKTRIINALIIHQKAFAVQSGSLGGGKMAIGSTVLRKAQQHCLIGSCLTLHLHGTSWWTTDGECALELDDSWSVTATTAAHAGWPVHDRRLFNLMVLDNLFSSLRRRGYRVRK